MRDFTDETRKLADLAVGLGANVQPGQIVAVTSYTGKEELTRAVTHAAYERGARYADARLGDCGLSRRIRRRRCRAALGRRRPRLPAGRARPRDGLARAHDLVEGRCRADHHQAVPFDPAPWARDRPHGRAVSLLRMACRRLPDSRRAALLPEPPQRGDVHDARP